MKSLLRKLPPTEVKKEVIEYQKKYYGMATTQAELDRNRRNFIKKDRKLKKFLERL